MVERTPSFPRALFRIFFTFDGTKFLIAENSIHPYLSLIQNENEVILHHYTWYLF